MKIGVPKEVKNNEYRVGLTPSSVKTLVDNGHDLFIQQDAGTEIGFLDSDYEKAGATILFDPKVLYEECELIVKVKEPIPEEFHYLNKKHTVFATERTC